jgi:hypothetical protein
MIEREANISSEGISPDPRERAPSLGRFNSYTPGLTYNEGNRLPGIFQTN